MESYSEVGRLLRADAKLASSSERSAEAQELWTLHLPLQRQMKVWLFYREFQRTDRPLNACVPVSKVVESLNAKGSNLDLLVDLHPIVYEVSHLNFVFDKKILEDKEKGRNQLKAFYRLIGVRPKLDMVDDLFKYTEHCSLEQKKVQRSFINESKFFANFYELVLIITETYQITKAQLPVDQAYLLPLEKLYLPSEKGVIQSVKGECEESNDSLRKTVLLALQPSQYLL